MDIPLEDYIDESARFSFFCFFWFYEYFIQTKAIVIMMSAIIMGVKGVLVFFDDMVGVVGDGTWIGVIFWLFVELVVLEISVG